jgi:anaerobic dimethyl sulfoxide reductase subunit A
VYINPADAEAEGITHGEKLKLTSIRNKSVYVAAHITETVRPGCLAMAEGSWVCLDENGVDIGGAVNTLFTLRPSRIARGTTMGNGIMLKVEKA